MAKDKQTSNEGQEHETDPALKLADILAVQFIAKLPIIGFDRKDPEIAYDLGDGHQITVGCIRQAKKLLGM